MQRPRTIVLAVVSATSDFQVQSVGDLMRNPEISNRMMGVITKPDGTLSRDDALRMIDLARNEDLKLGLGWHVVRNLSHEETDRSSEYRDSEESKFFTSGIWSRLPSKDLGVGSLRQKLCQRLFDSIKRELPELIREMNEQLNSTHHTLERLGRVRKTAKDCLWYLAEVRSSMYQLISAASDGIYDDPEIANFFGKGDFTKLRNLITMRSDLFNHSIRSSGKTFIVSSNAEEKSGKEHESPEPVLEPPYYSSQQDEGPFTVTIDAYCRALSKAMTQNRGKNLPDLPNFRDIQAVFRSQSVRWNSLAKVHVESCYDDTYTFMSEAISHIAGQYTSSRLLEEYIRPALEARRATLIDKLDELLWPFTQCHPITMHPEYASTARLLLDPNDPKYAKNDVSGTMWTSLAQQHRCPAEIIHAAHVFDRAEAYYEVSSVSEVASQICS